MRGENFRWIPIYASQKRQIIFSQKLATPSGFPRIWSINPCASLGVVDHLTLALHTANLMVSSVGRATALDSRGSYVKSWIKTNFSSDLEFPRKLHSFTLCFRWMSNFLFAEFRAVMLTEQNFGSFARLPR